MVESGRLADKNARRELVEQAFQLAASAKFPVRMEGLPGTTTDTAIRFFEPGVRFKAGCFIARRAARCATCCRSIRPKPVELFGQIVRPDAGAAHLR